MNSNPPALWSHHHHHHHHHHHLQVSPTSGGPGDTSTEDFSALFDFNDIPLSLSSPYGSTGGAQDDRSPMDTDFPNSDELSSNRHSGGVGGPLDSTHVLGSEEMLDMQFHNLHSLHQQQQQQHHQTQMLVRQHMMHHQGGMIPPTPSSIDLQTGLPHNPCSRIGSQGDIMMDQYSSLGEEQVIFTPLISPAVTPLDTSFVQQVTDFTIPGYFSPLTSPALNALPHRSSVANPHMIHNHSQSTSPVDPIESPNVTKRVSTGRRKSTTTSRNPPARVVRDSPSMKPQRKKLPATLAPASELVCALSKQPPTPTSRQNPSPYRSQEQTVFYSASTDGSSNESVSPEPLPDVLMAPPPPRSRNSRSPRNRRSAEVSPSSSTPGKPATPASLMKITKPNLPTEDIPPVMMGASDFLNGDIERIMEDAPTTPRTEGATKKASPRQLTPSIAADKAPSLKLPPSSTCSGSSGSNDQSPASVQVTGGGSNRKATRNGAGVRGGKRGSISSSPALQPKISPGIKPLLPQGMTPEASALLLKSNYQNIVEGTHKQLGLQYPADLSMNLTSKRTSHKLAEQGRRNRINNALAEIAALLPQKPSTGNISDGGGGNGNGNGSGGAGQTSKANTVEMAIDYIKELRKELEDTKEKLAEAERKLQAAGL